MIAEEKVINFSPAQLEYINFLAANQTDTEGNRYTKEQYAKQIGKVDPKTLYEWQKLPGFYDAVAELAPQKIIKRWYPKMIEAQIIKAVKQKDTTAFMALARQSGMLKADKTETKVELHNIDAVLE